MKHAIEQIAIYVSRMSGIRWTDIVEIIILSFLIYHILVWIKNTKAWSLLKGILVIAVFILFAAYFEMNTILWIVNNLFSVAVTAVVVILQPELRRAVEELGRKNIISSIIPITVGRGPEGGRFSDKTINEIVKACVEMGRARTGALIVMEKDESLTDYERTGIEIDGVVTSQLLINIFEHNHVFYKSNISGSLFPFLNAKLLHNSVQNICVILQFCKDNAQGRGFRSCFLFGKLFFFFINVLF